jgi:hypothetical protein
MSNASPKDNSSRAVVIVAILGLIGTLGAAWIQYGRGQATGQQQGNATAVQVQATTVADQATTFAALPASNPITQIAVTQVAITQIAITQVAVTQIVATSPPAPTPAPIVVVATPTMSPPTPEPDKTPAGTILSVGDTWKQDGAELTLVNVDFGAKQTNIAWRFKNNTGGSLLVQYS